MQSIDDFRKKMDTAGPPRSVQVTLSVIYNLDDGFGINRVIEAIESLADEARTMGIVQGTGVYGEETFNIS